MAAVAAWVVFHGAPLLALGILSYGDLVPSGAYATVATASLLAFLVGLMLASRSAPAAVSGMGGQAFVRVLPVVATYLRATAVPLTGLCGYYAVRTVQDGYGNVDPVPSILNVVLYVNLTLLPILFWNRATLERRDYVELLACVVLPRLVVSLFGPRFFVLQAVIPIVVWEIMHVRTLRVGRLLVAAVATYAVLFHVVPWARNDPESGFDHLLAGSPLGLLPQVERMGLLDEERPALIACEIAANVTTFDVCDLRRTFGVPATVAPRFDQVATYHAREITGIEAIGTGGNPVLEAFPGLAADANLLWFVMVGLVTGFVVQRGTTVALCAFLFPHVTSKALFLWRGSVSEFFDRIPLLLVAYALILLVASRVEVVTCETSR
jgi:hypothetical protein